MNGIKVNRTQKGTEMFIMLTRKTCPGLYENILNSHKALRTSGRCFSLMNLSFYPTTKSAELTLSSDLALNFPGRQQQRRISQAYPSNSRCLVAIPKNVRTNPIKGDQGFCFYPFQRPTTEQLAITKEQWNNRKILGVLI